MISAQRKQLDPVWIKTASEQLTQHFKQVTEFKTAKTVALYHAIAGEVDLAHLFAACWQVQKQTCIPVYNKTSGLYEFAVVTAATHYQRGNYNILEPISPKIISPSEIDLIAVPGVAFDDAGNRLGRGGGYYDRILTNYAGHTIGIAFRFQCVPAIPRARHDQPVNTVLTETGIV